MRFGRFSITQAGLAASTILVVFAPMHGFRSRPDPAIAAFEALRGDAEGLPNAIAGFRKAVENDPASPFRWCDLGEAYLASGDLTQARYCFTRGLQLGPKTPAIQFRLASYHLRTGGTTEALALMKLLLKDTPGFNDIVFSYYDRMALSVADIIASGFPENPETANAWLQHVRKTRPVADSAQVWRWMSNHAWPNDVQACDFMDYLLKQQQGAAAAASWAVYMAHRPGRASGVNLVLNGGFEQAPGRMALDWQVANSDDAHAGRDCQVSHSGHCSLVIHFDARQNLLYEGVTEKVLAGPGTYLLQAYVRASDITTDQGVRLRIAGADAPGFPGVVTRSIVGTTDWTLIRQVVTIPAGTHAVVIQVIRERSEKFENQIKGDIWLDDVSLSPVRA